MRSSSLVLSAIFLISLISPVLIAQSQNQYIQPIQIHGFKNVGTLPKGQTVVFTVYVPLKNLNLLYYYAQAVSNPSSPLYHHFLSKEQVAKLFYPTEEFNQVLSYLKEKGFKVLFTAADSVIVAQGTVGQIEDALGVKYALYSNGTLTYYTVYGVPKLGVYVVSDNVSRIFYERPSTIVTQKYLEPLYQKVNMTFAIEAYWPTALQKVYNLTSLYSKGYEGQNYTIGILAFFGDPYISQQLAYFDKITGLPDPPNFTIIPIGPYNPNLGIITGWADEISLDVEVAHAMAPKANIILYIGDIDLPLFALISYIVSQNKVDVLSQSFIIPESAFSSFFNAQTFFTNVFLTDQYYAMGVAQGITFLASSGDAGGSGYSEGPIGAVGYPSVSPYVIAVGGTTTYIQFPNGSYHQTAWSNYGFVPPFANFGGSTGGISIIEPKPWYQFSLATPITYPNGREVPDLSANANVFPGVYIVFPGNQTFITGGTSESSPLVAGALVTVMSYLGHRLGLITPTLYMIAQNSSLYSKVFYPITFGYNIPWTASYGYNLVTGWGAVNYGQLAVALSTLKAQPQLSISVGVYDESGKTPMEFFPGQTMLIVANITYYTVPITSGTFFATIETVYGNVTTVAMSFDPNSKMWVATTVLPSDANGILYVYVYGKSSGISGLGYYETFSGYYLTFLYPVTGFVFDDNITPIMSAYATDIYGMPAPKNMTFHITLYGYNITTNTYAEVGTTILIFDPEWGEWVGILSGLPSGVVLAKGDNAFGFDAFMNGIYLRYMFILPNVLVEPGSVAEGQYVVIVGFPLVPTSISPIAYLDFLYGANVTAYLLDPSGKVVSSARILLSPSGFYQGFLYVPKGLPSGLYTVILTANYDSYALNQNLTGQFFGQIYVVPSYSVPQIKTTSYAYEGQTIQIYANITYPNGTEVKFGMYSATIYPHILSSNYSQITGILQIPLWYNPALGVWVGNATLPSSLSLGNLTYFPSTYNGVPFDIYVSGISADGVPTTTNISAQYMFNVLPYTMIEGKVIDAGQIYNAYLVNDIITGNVTLINDILVNTTIEGHVTIINSNVSSITVKGGSVNIVNSFVNDLVAINSKVTLVGTVCKYLNLTGSTINLVNSKVINVYPKLPIVTITSPKENENLTGTITISYTISGSDISEVELLINGKLVTTLSPTTTTYTLDTASYPDGTYNITVVAIQKDGMSNSSSVTVSFQNQLSKLHTNLNNAYHTLNSITSSLDNKISSVNTYALVGIALAVIGIIIGIVALVRRKR